MAGVYVLKVTITNNPLVIIPGLVNVYLTMFPIGGNTDSIYIGDKNVSYTNKYGMPIGQFAIYQKKIFVEDSNQLYYSGLAGDQMGVVIEQSAIIDDVLPSLDDLQALINATNGGVDLGAMQAQLDALTSLIKNAKPSLFQELIAKL